MSPVAFIQGERKSAFTIETSFRTSILAHLLETDQHSNLSFRMSTQTILLIGCITHAVRRYVLCSTLLGN